MISQVDFRQGSIGQFNTTFITQNGEVIEQPVGFPTIHVIYIDLKTLATATAIPTTQMKMSEEAGHYYHDWHIPIDQEVTQYQIIYRGWIEGDHVIGEDVVTVLPLILKCALEPTIMESTVCSPSNCCGGC